MRVAALETATREGYHKALDELLPLVAQQDVRIAEMTDTVLEKIGTALESDDFAALKAVKPLLSTLFAERKGWVDRKFGSAVQRNENVNVNIEGGRSLSDLIRSKAYPQVAESADEIVAEVVDDGE